MQSCTRFIKAITVKNSGDDGDEDMIICDSPGLEDTRGPELDVANIYGVVLAAHESKSILPIIILNSNGMGDRMTSFKHIS